MAVKYLMLLLLGVSILVNGAHHHPQHSPKSKIVHTHKAHHVAGNVRSFSFEDSAEGSGQADKRTVYKSLEEEFNMEKRKVVAKAYKDAINTMLDGPTDEKAFDSAGDSLMSILEIFQSTGGDIFKQLATKMKVQPAEFYRSVVGQNKEDISDMIKNKKVTKKQWITLKDTKYRFLPSQKHYSAIDYTKDFYPDIVAYIMVFVAATVDLTFKGEIYKCQLSKELDLFKNDVETAVQALIYKRLHMLEPHSSEWKWVDISLMSGRDRIGFKDTYEKKMLCGEKGCVLNDGEGKMPVEEAIIGVASSVLDDATPMFDFIDRFLALVNQEKPFCFEGCICPPVETVIKMERGDYVKDFPWSCLGKTKDDKKPCKLPCGKYGESYNWCPTELKTRASPWGKCNLPDKSICAQGWFKK